MPDYSPGPYFAPDSDYPVLTHIVADLAPPGVACEFGVGAGHSLAIIAAHMYTIGFDSFTGLPERWRRFPVGAFATRPPAIPNTRLVIGSFADTLPHFDFAGLGTIGVVHIDCDLYSSTTTVLAHIGKHLTAGCYVVFDEFTYDDSDEVADEARAWREFVDDSGTEWDVIGHCGESWAIRIKE